MDDTTLSLGLDIPRKWSIDQIRIFKYFALGKGNLVVRARAGCGKTTTGLEGIDRAPESEILCSTFSKASTKDTLSRLKNPHAKAMTCHAMGMGYLMRWNPNAELNEWQRTKAIGNAVLPAEAFKHQSVLSLFNKLQSKARELTPLAKTANHIKELAVRFDLVPQQEDEVRGFGMVKMAGYVIEALRYAQQPSRYIDFSDQIFQPYYHRLITPKFGMGFIDEAQDLTPIQLEMAQQAVVQDGRIVIIGDDMQGIYSFRGADTGSLDRLKGMLNAKELGLKVTYRCPQVVVDMVTDIVPDYVCGRPDHTGKRIDISQNQIAKIIELAKPKDFILSRTNAPLARVAMELWKAGVPAIIKGRDFGQGLVAKLRAFQKNGIMTAAELGPALQEWRTAESIRLTAMTDVNEEIVEKRIQMIDDTCDFFVHISEGLSTVEEMAVRIAKLFSESEDNGVILSSVHRAKGLETNQNFVLMDTLRKGGEEDCIRYVAITRAMNTICPVYGIA